MTKLAVTPHHVHVTEPVRAAGLADFETIYQRDFDYVWRTLCRFGVPAADVPDAVHDVFVVLHRRLGDLDPSQSIRGWLFGVARKVAASTRRKRRETDAPSSEPVAAEDELAAQRQLLWRALATLDEDRRDVIILHDLEGHTGIEIAAILGVPSNTVHSRLRLGRLDLIAAIERMTNR